MTEEPNLTANAADIQAQGSTNPPPAANVAGAGSSSVSLHSATPSASETSKKTIRVAMWEEASNMVTDASYSSRAHFIAGQSLRDRAKFLGVPAALLSVVASAGAGVAAIIGIDKGWIALLAFAGALIAALDRYFDPIGQANAHSLKGDRYLTLRNEARFYREARLRSTDTETILQRDFLALRHRYDELRESAPHQVPSWAYDRARAQIADGQADYVGDPTWVPAPDDLG